jgi:hypothetical protein
MTSRSGFDGEQSKPIFTCSEKPRTAAIPNGASLCSCNNMKRLDLYELYAAVLGTTFVGTVVGYG